MTSLLISILLWILKQGAPNQIAERNRLKTDAERAFAVRDYALATRLYRQLTESAFIPEPAVLFNHAQACFASNDTLLARTLYARLARINDPTMAATALSQLGVIAWRSGDSAQALLYFEQAIRNLPTYEPARYNYELIRKTQPLPNVGPPPLQTEANPRVALPRPQRNGSVPNVPTERRNDLLKRLDRYQLTEQKARMLLDAMRAEEIQYIQQRRFGYGPTAETTPKQTW